LVKKKSKGEKMSIVEKAMWIMIGVVALAIYSDVRVSKSGTSYEIVEYFRELGSTARESFRG
jgi:cell division protein FtsL